MRSSASIPRPRHGRRRWTAAPSAAGRAAAAGRGPARRDRAGLRGLSRASVGGLLVGRRGSIAIGLGQHDDRVGVGLLAQAERLLHLRAPLRLGAPSSGFASGTSTSRRRRFLESAARKKSPERAAERRHRRPSEDQEPEEGEPGADDRRRRSTRARGRAGSAASAPTSPPPGQPVELVVVARERARVAASEREDAEQPERQDREPDEHPDPVLGRDVTEQHEAPVDPDHREQHGGDPERAAQEPRETVAHRARPRPARPRGPRAAPARPDRCRRRRARAARGSAAWACGPASASAPASLRCGFRGAACGLDAERDEARDDERRDGEVFVAIDL